MNLNGHLLTLKWSITLNLSPGFLTELIYSLKFIFNNLHQMRVCQRFAVFRVGRHSPVDLADGDLHPALAVHEALRHELEVQTTTLNKTKSFRKRLEKRNNLKKVLFNFQ